MRIGVFGGTFDPVHYGHLIIAEWCREQGQLDGVLFVPAARPPHKPDDDITPFDQRMEMLQLAAAGNPSFRIDALEKDRPGPSYTVETLRAIRKIRPNDKLFLMMGADSILDFPNWYQPDAIVELATLMVTARPNFELPSEDGIRELLPQASREKLDCIWISVPLIDIASRDVRRRVREQRSIRYLVPPAVEAYVNDKGLYCS